MIMKKMIETILILLVMSNLCIAQERLKLENIDVTQDQNLSENESLRNAVYIFPEFMQGKVFFKNGTTSSAKLNYNTLIGEMQFLDNDENILSIANPQDVEFVLIDKKVFCHFSGKTFIQLVLMNENIKLFVKRFTESTEHHAKGAYGQSNTTSAITNINTTYSFKKNELSVYKELRFNIRDEFYLENNGKFNKINNMKSFTKIFPQFKNEIIRFAESNKTNFKNEKDVIMLTNYCTQLSLIKNK